MSALSKSVDKSEAIFAMGRSAKSERVRCDHESNTLDVPHLCTLNGIDWSSFGFRRLSHWNLYSGPSVRFARDFSDPFYKNIPSTGFMLCSGGGGIHII